MTTIESLENSLDILRRQSSKLEKYLEMRQPKSRKEGAAISRLFYPKLEGQCRNLIEATASHTLDFGFSERSDYVKDKVFGILGIVIGEDI